jgi:DNA replication protein DnaC
LREQPKTEWVAQLERTADQMHADAGVAFQAALNGKLPWPVVLCGPAGLGKTCAALALCDWVERSEFFNLSQLARTVDAAREGRLEKKIEGTPGLTHTVASWWRFVTTVPLFCLDEIGVRRPTDAQYEVLLNFLDARPAPRWPSVVMSNLSLSELSRVYDDRIISRLDAGTVLHLQGPDRRLGGSRHDTANPAGGATPQP